MNAVRSAWEAFQGGRDPSPRVVSPLILESWRRSMASGVSADLRAARAEDLSEVSAERSVSPTHNLFAVVGELVVQELARDLLDTGCVAVLSDAGGTVLCRAGERTTTRRTDRAHLSPGAAWTEGAAGTNGIGLALALGRLVNVVAEEHFCAGWHGYSCTTAPVRHPVTREVLGGLTLTVPAARHALGIMTALARRGAHHIEHDLGERMLGPERALVQRHLRAGATRDPVITMDRRGNVVLETPAAVRLLRGDARETVLALMRRVLAAPAAVREPLRPGRGAPKLVADVSAVRWRGEVVGAIATVDGPVSAAASTLVAREREIILDCLARHDGNISAVAEELDVSRSTIYRKLRSYR